MLEINKVHELFDIYRLEYPYSFKQFQTFIKDSEE